MTNKNLDQIIYELDLLQEEYEERLLIDPKLQEELEVFNSIKL